MPTKGRSTKSRFRRSGWPSARSPGTPTKSGCRTSIFSSGSVLGVAETPRDKLADKFQITQPTKPYTDMTFGMGKRGYPAICMTQHSARVFCQWLSAKTGRYYRLPTEAEWEYACRAGTTTAYSFGDDPAQLGEYAWYLNNSEEKYQKVGLKKPNPWGLYDMHGNVAEWCLDQHTTDFYAKCKEQGVVKDPLAIPLREYKRVVRGGSWDDGIRRTRSAARVASSIDWKQQDPQVPQSIWYFTDALFLGFRVVRPLDRAVRRRESRQVGQVRAAADR